MRCCRPPNMSSGERRDRGCECWGEGVFAGPRDRATDGRARGTPRPGTKKCRKVKLLETNKNKMHQKCPAPSKSPHAPARREIDRTACVGVACNHQRRWHPASIRLTSSEAHKASIASIHRYIMIQGMRAHIIASERSSSPASAHHPSARPIARARAAQSQRRQLVSVRVLVSCPARQCAATWQRCSQ